MKSPFNWFRRKAPAAATPAQAGTLAMPWNPKGTKAANIAMHYVESLLMNGLQDSHGIHVETLMTVIGAVTGFAAQNAVWESVVKPGKMPAFDAKNMQAGAFVIAETHNGEKYYFGDTLNSYLIPQATKYGADGRFTLYSLVAAVVQAAGKKPLDEATFAEMFRNSTSTIGGPAFGVPRLPAEHMPKLTPREALHKFWRPTKEALQFKDPHLVGDGPDDFTPLGPEHWPLMLSIVAQRLVDKAKGAIDVTLAMRIIFEAAIPMSKVDPATLPIGS